MTDDVRMSAVPSAVFPAPDHENRRRSVRRPYAMEAWISSPTATDEAEILEANAVNLSRHGVRFEMNQTLPVGCFYRIELGMGDQKLNTEIRIVSSRQTGTGRFSIGAAFC